ncbi:MAG: hypothetical protein WBI82_15130 [Sphaerochaeta sp.]
MTLLNWWWKHIKSVPTGMVLVGHWTTCGQKGLGKAFEIFFPHDFQDVEDLKEAIDNYGVLCKGGRRHQRLGYLTPTMKYFSTKENI